VPAAVGVIVVNYNGGALTLECLRSVLATEWPSGQLRVVLVDNASTDDVVATVRRDLPQVEVIESPVNGGFGAACNLGFAALVDTAAVALVNNDATVEPGWLAPLHAALARDPGLGAACPKILYAGQFVEVSLQTTTSRRGRGDARDLGVLVAGARVAGEDVWRRVQLVDGFWGPEPASGDTAAQWSAASATLRLPVGPGDQHEATLLLSAEHAARVELGAGGLRIEHEIGREPSWVEAPLAGTPFEVVNNVGTVLTADGYGADRGRFDPDDGRDDEPVEVFAWSGGAVLLRREYLADVGGFDERFFMYYEDLDLAWRGAERGWRYRYVPESVVRHVHAASSVEGSSFKRYYDERNHLLVLARHAGSRVATRAAFRSLLTTASYVRRDVVAPALSRRSPQPRIVTDRLSALAGFLKLGRRVSR
jgi:GT2 family glycosyltransferase